MEIRYQKFGIEITRKCNEVCAHCLRGPAENIDINNSIIDAFLDNNITLIEELLITGGEPTMNGEGLEYFVDGLIKRNITIGTYKVIVNGTNWSESFGRAIRKLDAYTREKGWKDTYLPLIPNIGYILISQDKFHMEAKEEVVEKLRELPCPVYINERSGKILPYGRADDNNLSVMNQDITPLIDYSDSYIIMKYGKPGVEFKKQCLCANGNVVSDYNYPFEIMDACRIGNVLDDNIINMYDIKEKVNVIS
jgi:hypothetical protein